MSGISTRLILHLVIGICGDPVRGGEHTDVDDAPASACQSK